MSGRRLALTAMLACGLLGSSPAQEVAPAAAVPAPMLAPRGGSTGQMTVYVVLLLALFAGGAWLLRNGMPGFNAARRGERRLHIRETRGLGGRQFLVVAEYDGRKLLLGVCPGRIDHLCTLAGAEPEFSSIEPEKAE